MAKLYPGFKNYQEEGQLFNRRLSFASLMVLLAFLVLLGRMIYLQVIRHEHYITLAQDNRVKLIPIPPTRGLIYDRNYQLLAFNRPAFNLEIIPEKITRVRGERLRDSLDKTIAQLGQILNIDEKEKKRFYRLLQQKRRFDSIPIKQDISPQQAALFAVNRYDFSGVSIQARLIRTYPLGDLLAHVVGYVGRISKKDLQRIDTSEYAGTQFIGKTGIEQSYEKILHGQVGMKQVEVNVSGKTVRVLEEKPAQPGKSLRLHLDIRLQRVALDALGDYKGAIVAIEPKTGGILAMVSKPSFDPNPFVKGIGFKAYAALRDDPKKPLFNRVLRGTYPPGSTIKPFMGLAGLELGFIDYQTTKYCPGYFQLPGKKHKYRDWKITGHGFMNLDAAITQSCDVYFYQLAHEIEIDKLQAYLKQFYFGEKTGIDLIGEKKGIRPSREWKRKRHNQVWFPGETINMGIGQGAFTTTPLQLAAATAAIANRGLYREPRLVAEIIDEATGYRSPVISPQHQIRVHDPAHWHQIETSMRHVIEGNRGTARRIRSEYYSIAGKTGTAQVFTVGQDEKYEEDKVEEHKRDHALFVAYAPVENPQIAIAVIVENGGHGGATAAPIAKQVLDAWLLGFDHEK